MSKYILIVLAQLYRASVLIRRAFTTDGVAAGVAAGFNAPIGGMLFAMEDLSSFWSKGLSWQTFFCAVIATAVAQVFNTAFVAFKYQGSFGSFNLEVRLLHQHSSGYMAIWLFGCLVFYRICFDHLGDCACSAIKRCPKCPVTKVIDTLNYKFKPL